MLDAAASPSQPTDYGGSVLVLYAHWNLIAMRRCAKQVLCCPRLMLIGDKLTPVHVVCSDAASSLFA